MKSQEPGASPPSPDETGGANKPHRELITKRDVVMVVIAISLTLGVAAYLDDRLNQIQTAVHDNARGLAVVQTEITALRRDVERLEKHAAHDEPASASNPDKLAFR